MTFWNATYEVARKEVLQHIRTKRLLIIASLIVLSLILITIVFGPDIARGMDLDVVATENFVLLVYFSTFFIGGYFFMQLLAIVLTADAVCSEWSSRTIFLLLSKPVSRTAFVLGKFLGSYVTVAATLVVLFTLDYALLQPMYEGSPRGEEVLGFFGALGILVLGAGAFTALALFLSTVTRSTVMALLATLGAWIIVMPLLGQIGLFIEIGQDNPDLDSNTVQAWRYLNPGSLMGAAGALLVTDDEVRAGLDFISGSPENVGGAILGLLVHTAVWFGLAILVVQRRNFE